MERSARKDIEGAKEEIQKELMLVISDLNKRSRLEAYLSKSLNKTERNYKIYNKEILVVIRDLENWKYLLESTKFKFEVWTDHKNLKYFIKI